MEGCHLIIWDVFHKTISSLSFFVVGFPTTPFDPSPKDAFSNSLWQKLAFSSPFFILIIYLLLLSPGGIVLLLFSNLFLVHIMFIILTGVLCPFAQILFILSSFASLFNWSAIRICSSLFLLSNGVFSTSFISVVFFYRNCLTSQGSLVSLACQRGNLVLPLLFLFSFSPVPSLGSRVEILL